MNTPIEMRDMKHRRWDDKPDILTLAAMVITRLAWVVGSVVLLILVSLGVPEFIELVLTLTGRGI